MKVIIAKKERGIQNYKNGFIRPLFESEGNNVYRPIQNNEYPNNNLIFISDYELLDSDIDNEIFIMENCFFIDDDKSYPLKQSDLNASKKRINYNAVISNYFKAILPYNFIPVYSNSFDIKKSRLMSPFGIGAKIFFLENKNENTIYGPFERDNYELKAVNFANYEEYFEDVAEFKEFLEDYSDYDGNIIFRFNVGQLDGELISHVSGEKYVINFSNLTKGNLGEHIEFTSISILQNWAAEKIKLSGIISDDVIEQLKSLEIPVNSSIETLRWKRFLNIVKSFEERNSIINDLANILHEKWILNNFSESIDIKNKEKEIEILHDEISLKNKEIVNLKDKKIELEDLLKEKEEKNTTQINSDKFPNLANVFNQSESNLSELEELLTNSHCHQDLTEEIKRLKFEKDYISNDIKKEEDILRTIKDSIQKIKHSFEGDVSNFIPKLFEAKTFTDLLNGINIEKKEHIIEDEIVTKEILPLPSEYSNPRSFILEIQRRIKSQNRDLTFNEVANLIVTINQTFLTIIAGAPGVGKTSLANKFANSLGLTDSFGYLEINCSRGWTSSKDILGFFNPLTGKYQEAKTKLAKALRSSSNTKNLPFLVLLDEANLSPIEHYWSDFIKLSDLDYKRSIKLSESENIEFGQGFRFLATINHDHTTEYLSNRLLDRAAIIQIERPSLINEGLDKNDQFDFVFDYFEIQKLFSETPKWKSDEELIKKFLKHIIEKLEANNTGIVISPRKEIAIKKYCKACTGIMEGNTYTALDYAVAQHIIPLISGRGETFENTLKQLKNDFNDKGMVKSEKLLSKIIEKGKDLKQFKYIYY